MTARWERLNAALRNARLDALAIIPGSSMRYLSGMDMHAGMRLSILFCTVDGPPAMVVPALEQPRAAAQSTTPIRFYPWHDSDGFQRALQACVQDLYLAGKTVGIEYTSMRALELRALEAAAPGIELVDGTGVVAELRMAKDADELRAMRQAVQIIETALDNTIAQVQVGMTELALAEVWNNEIRAAGAQASFDLIVASGPNAANPHHTNGNRHIQAGDLVILDGGALVDGYASDITRTIAVGEVDEELRRIYDLVNAANAAARAAVAPGVSGEAVDRAARAVITDGGYGAQFLHRTGHGLGLDVHEPPYIVAGNTTPLQPGTTFTIEPGIYLEGKGGVRIEDDVVVTSDGGESLTSFRRELIVVDPR